MQQEDLIRYITGNATPEEADRVKAWIGLDDQNRKEFFRLKNIHALSGKEMEDIDLTREYRALQKQMDHPAGRLVLFRKILQYAAVACISVLLTWMVLNREKSITEESVLVYNEVIVPKGQISEYVFSDGTHVWLNSASRLRFPVNAGLTNREVYLEGEAYFDVARNEKHPFLVHTGSMDIMVLGTSFNVQNYPDMENTETTLVEGRLEIRNMDRKVVATMKPGEQMKFSRTTRSGTLLKVDTAPYQAWKEGKLIFRDKSLGEIAGSLERWYNVRLIFSDEKIRNYRFTGTILKYKPFDQILQAIRLTTPIRYQIRVLPESSNDVTLFPGE
jgi:transmembrane sensor